MTTVATQPPKPSSMPASAMLFLVVAVLALFGGLLNLSNATAGVGGIAVACLFAIFARIAQAAAYHRREHK